MNPITHFFASWCLANSADIDQRDRFLVTIAGVIPDVDGLGAIAYLVTKDSAAPSRLYHDYHHILCHNILAAIVFTTIVVLLFAHKKKVTAMLVFLSYHIHLLCDILGSSGPDGHQWPIPYFLPFSDKVQLTWAGQWRLASWQNSLITVALMLVGFALARKKGFSFLEIFSKKADEALVYTVRTRFPLEESE